MARSERANQRSFTKRVIENLFFSSIGGAISKIGALIFTIIVARNFLPELFGLYSLALTIILIIFALSDFGLNSTLVRYLAESLGKKDKKQARSRFWFLAKYKIILSAVVSLALFLFAGAIAIFFKKPELTLPLKIGSIYLFLNAFHALGSNIFLSLQKVKYSTIAEAIFQISRIALLFVSLYFFKSVESVFIILSLSIIFSLIFSIKVLKKKKLFLFKGKKEKVERRRMLKFSGFLALGSFTLLLYSNIDKLVLGYFMEIKFIGFYNAIFTLVGGVLGLIGFTAILFPIFTQLKGKNLRKVFKKVFHYSSLVAFPAAVGLAFVILPAMQIIYGPEYVPSQYMFSLLLTSIFLSLLILEFTFSSLYRILLNAKEKPKIPAITNIITFAVNLILNILFISYLIRIEPSYGLIGASAATFISRYLGLGIIFTLSKKRIRLVPDARSITKPLFASLIMLAYLFLFKLLIPLNILTGILMILSAAIFYFILILGMKAISLKEIKNLFKR